MSKPLISVTRVNNKGIETQLTRIADALEVFLEYQFNYKSRPTPKPAHDDSDVGYSDDRSTLKMELIDIVEHRPPERSIGDED